MATRLCGSRRSGALLVAITTFGFSAGPSLGEEPQVSELFPAQISVSYADRVNIAVFGSNLFLDAPCEDCFAVLELSRPGFPPVLSFTYYYSSFFDELRETEWAEFDSIDLSGFPAGTLDAAFTRADGAQVSVPAAIRLVDPGVTVSVVGAWGGRVRGVHVEGQLAYVCAGQRLVIVDITDPLMPVELGAVNLQASANDVLVSSGYAFVAGDGIVEAHTHGVDDARLFSVVDVSNPVQPQLVYAGCLQGTNSHCPGGLTAGFVRMELHGSQEIYAISEHGHNVHVIDVTTPAQPVYAGDRLQVAATIYDFALAPDGTELYALLKPGGPAQVHIYDVSSAAFQLEPPPLGSVVLATDSYADGVSLALQGDHVYATTSHTEGVLAIIHVANPAQPTVTGVFDTVSAGEVDVSGGVAFLADGGDLKVIDVSTNPAAPQLLATVQTHGSIYGVEVFGPIAVAKDGGEGAILFDVSNPSQPVRLGNYHSPERLRKAVKDQGLLYVTDSSNGFSILDIANPAAPALVGVYQTTEFGHGNWDVAVRDGLAYLAAGHAGIEIVDVADPTSPSLVGHFPLSYPSYAAALTLAGDTASVGIDGRVKTFDISDPSDIALLGCVHVGGTPVAIELGLDGVAFSGNTGDADVVDVSDPAQPTILSSTPPSAFDLVWNTGYLYASADNGPLGIVDVTDPTAPAIVWSLPADSRVTGVAVQNRRAYFPDAELQIADDFSFILLDATLPAAPVGIDVPLGLPGCTGLVVDEPYLYAADDHGSGLTVLRFDGLAPPGDQDLDTDIDLADLAATAACLAGPVVSQAPAGCSP